MTSTSLATLPTEIFYRILIYGPVSNVLALSRVSKDLRTTCIDPLFHQLHISHRDDFEDETNEPKWWQSINLSSEKNWQCLARWSFADEQARKIYSSCPVERSSGSVNTLMTKTNLSYLPELVLHGHKIAQLLLIQSEPLKLSPQLNPSHMSIDQISRLAFCDACRCPLLSGTSQLVSAYIIQNVPLEQEMPYYQLTTAMAAYRTLYPELSTEVLLLGNSTDVMPQFFDSASIITTTSQMNPAFIKHHLLATLIAGILRESLCDTLTFGTLSMEEIGVINAYPPLVHNIPFHQLYTNRLVPFDTSDLASRDLCFLTLHLEVMTSPTFLADGEWNGYYCFVDPTDVMWDGIMHSIHFGVTATYADHSAVTSRGQDACGSFLLFGTVHRRSGWIQMTKQYNNVTVWSWSWSGFMTPFGIIATWGNTSGEGGWVWLWKKSWNPGLNPLRPSNDN